MPRPRKYKTNADRSRAYRERKKDKEQALRVELDRLSADNGGRPGERPKTGWDYRRVTTAPGEMLVEEFLKPLGISEKQLALYTSQPVSRINACGSPKRRTAFKSKSWQIRRDLVCPRMILI
jgi:hypothetical protein